MRSLDRAQGRFLDSGRKWSWEVRGLVSLRRMRFQREQGLGGWIPVFYKDMGLGVCVPARGWGSGGRPACLCWPRDGLEPGVTSAD